MPSNAPGADEDKQQLVRDRVRLQNQLEAYWRKPGSSYLA